MATIFDPDAYSVLLRAHLCTAVDSMSRKPCVRNCSREREGLYNGNIQQNPLCAVSCHEESLHLAPVLAYGFLSRCKFSAPTSTSLYSSSSNRLYAQNPVFEIVHDESVKVYIHIMYNGNVRQNPLCVEFCVAKEFSISPRFSPTIFDPDVNSVLLRTHLRTAVEFVRRKPCVRNCSR